jgi:hypothetical protein
MKMIALAFVALFTTTAFPDASSLDNAAAVSLGAVGLSRQSAIFDPVAMSYYRTGQLENPLVTALSANPWHVPVTMGVVQRDATMSANQPHKLAAVMSRLSPYGSRRDLLGDPSSAILSRNPSGESLAVIVQKYRDAGLITKEPQSQGLVPDDLKRAIAILLDAIFSQRRLYDTTFPNPDDLVELKRLTKSEAFNGSDPKSFGRWLNLAKDTDLNYLGAASQDLAATANAMRGLIQSAQAIGQFEWRLGTQWGEVVIQDSRQQTTNLKNILVLIDTGGNDTYLEGSDRWCSILIDGAGNDSYLSGTGYAGKAVRDADSRKNLRLAGGPGRAFFSVSVLIDESGDDLYRSAGQAFGSATFGFSYGLDVQGKDVYDTYSNSLGYGFFGIGIQDDLAGDDEYRTFTQSQGCGMTAGVGLLIDRGGNDQYHAEDKVIDFPSPQSAEHNVSMSQGAGYGLRYDYLFGNSLAGGFGTLFDLGGSDFYSSGVFSQGVGYWMGMGVLWDREGEDQYESVWYGQGAGAHFGIGFLEDEEGDDEYIGLMNMTQGAGHDFSLGFFVDHAGNDKYSSGSLALGAGNANGFGAFFDLVGNDQYQVSGSNQFGKAVESPEGSLRKYALTLGIFNDGGGNDQYLGDSGVRNGAKRVLGENSRGALGVFWDQ